MRELDRLVLVNERGSWTETLPIDTVLVIEEIYPIPAGAYYGFSNLGDFYRKLSILNGGDKIPDKVWAHENSPEKIVITALSPHEYTIGRTKESPEFGNDDPTRSHIIYNTDGQAKIMRNRKGNLKKLGRRGNTFVKPGSRPLPSYMIVPFSS